MKRGGQTVVQQASTSRGHPHASADATAPAQPLSKRLWALRGWVVLVGLFVFTASTPLWADPSLVRDLIELLCYVGMALAWNLLAGYGGQVSIGQQAFLGLGAYAAFAAVNFGQAGLLPAVLAAAVICALAAVIAAPLLFRLHAGYFAIGSWVLADALRLLISNLELLGGSSGLSLRWHEAMPAAERANAVLWVTATMAFGSLAAMAWVLRSPLGLALSAMRDNAQAAESQGVPVARVRALVFLAAAVAFGVFGALYYLVALRVSPAGAFDVRWAVLIIFMVVIGGVGSIEGPVLGAVLFFLLDRWLSDYGSAWLMALGAVALWCAVFQRSGLWGLAQGWTKRPLTLFPARWH